MGSELLKVSYYIYTGSPVHTIKQCPFIACSSAIRDNYSLTATECDVCSLLINRQLNVFIKQGGFDHYSTPLKDHSRLSILTEPTHTISTTQSPCPTLPCKLINLAQSIPHTARNFHIPKHLENGNTVS